MGHHLQRPGSCVPQDLPAAVLRQQRAACGLLLAPHCPTYLRHSRCRPCSVQIPFPTLQCPKHGAVHVTPSPQPSSGPGSMRPAKDRPVTRRKPAQPRKTPAKHPSSAERACIYLFFQERSCPGCACLCQDNRKNDAVAELPGNSRPSARVESSFSSSFVLKGM